MEQPETLNRVRSSEIVRRLDCYVGIKPCGCMVAWAYDDPKHPKDVAKSVADFIKSGYSVERANTDEVRRKLGKCKCAKPSNAEALRHGGGQSEGQNAKSDSQ